MGSERVETILVCRASPRRIFFIVLLNLIMLGAAGFCVIICLTHPSTGSFASVTRLVTGLAGVVGFLFFGFTIWIWIRPLFDRGRQVIFDRQGIHDSHTPFGFIPWSEVRRLYVGRLRHTCFLCVDVASPENYLAGLPRWRQRMLQANRALGFSPISISFLSLEPGLPVVLQFLQQQYRDESRSVPIECLSDASKALRGGANTIQQKPNP